MPIAQVKGTVSEMLAIDIGNTAITVGLFSGRRLKRTWSTDRNGFPKIVLKIAKSGKNDIKKAILCSVDPKLSHFVKKTVSKDLQVSAKEVGRDIRVNISHKYFKINKLGKDRLVNLWGAVHFKTFPVVIVDFGTAVTVDYLSERGVFEGGLILPGLQLALDSLHQRTALLPWVQFKPARSFLGRSPKEGMQNAVFWGWVEMINGLLNKLKPLSKKKLHVLLTGGMSPLFRRHIRSFQVTVDPSHTLRSLACLAHENKGE